MRDAANQFVENALSGGSDGGHDDCDCDSRHKR